MIARRAAAAGGARVVGVGAVAALAAAALWAIGATGWAPLLHGGGHAHAAPGLEMAVWTGGWALMVTAMMLPVAAPLLGATRRGRALLAGAYLGPWIAAGAVVWAAVLLAGAAPLWAGLVAAGAYQLTPAKRRSLAACRARRAPAALDGGDPTGDAVRAGLAHAAATLRCCGPLMALMVLGLTGPAWMLLLGAVMAIEAIAPPGARLRVPIGAVLLVAGAVVALAGASPGG
ncbi:MAG: DUF2182 domain-containing protein [Thermoleophilia bacterium]